MRQAFDVVVIGSGPSAVAALAGLPQGLSIAIATGEDLDSSFDRATDVHAKVRLVAHERNEAVGMGRFLPFLNHKGAMLADTATIGGLANYWGQQFVNYAKGDPWPSDIFTSYSEYLAGCSAIEALFNCSSGDDANSSGFYGNYIARTPRLLIGTKDRPSAGLFSLREALGSLVSALGAELHSAFVKSWREVDGSVRLDLSDGGQLTARRVILAAGVVGSLRLTMASCPELQSARLKDHAPTLMYLLRISGRPRLARTDRLAHFNSLTLEKVHSERVKLFASFYRMSRAPIGLTLAALGLPPLLSRTRPPGFVDLLTPVQVWTEQSQMQYQIDRDAPFTRLINQADHDADEELRAFHEWLTGLGIVLRKSGTPPGFGFHYHAGEVSSDGVHFQNLTDFLRDRFSDRIVCTDASLLQGIGPRPHTLTAMAVAYHICKRSSWT